MTMIINDITFNEQHYPIGSINWVVLEAGEGHPVFLLHGFPDTPLTFRHQVKPLLDSGYKVILPYLPGYHPSTISGQKYYNVANLGTDLSQLIRAMGYQQVSVIGHDWGCVGAYLLAAVAPELVDKMICCAVPQARGFARSDAKQLWRSRYMLLFQLPGSESLVKRNDYRYIQKLFDQWSPDWRDNSEHLEQVKRCLDAGNSLTVALGYYRTMFRQAPRNAQLREAMQKNVSVPTLAVGGRNDGCITIQALENQSDGFDADYRLLVIEGAGHFCHIEKPESFNPAMLDFLCN